MQTPPTITRSTSTACLPTASSSGFYWSRSVFCTRCSASSTRNATWCRRKTACATNPAQPGSYCGISWPPPSRPFPIAIRQAAGPATWITCGAAWRRRFSTNTTCPPISISPSSAMWNRLRSGACRSGTSAPCRRVRCRRCCTPSSRPRTGRRRPSWNRRASRCSPPASSGPARTTRTIRCTR